MKQVFASVGIIVAAVFAWLIAAALAFGAFEHSATGNMIVIALPAVTVALAVVVVLSLALVWWKALRARLGRTR